MSPIPSHEPDHHTVAGSESESIPQTQSTSRRTISRDPASDVVEEAVRRQQLWAAGKSRGVSKFERFMSANHAVQDAQSKEDEIPWALSTEKIERYDFEPAQPRERQGISQASGTQSWKMQNRPRPPPPLTPPVLDPSSLSFDERASRPAVGKVDETFFGLPNPDYMSATMDSMPMPESSSTAVNHQKVLSATPRRRSYTKVMQIGGDETAANDSTMSLHHHESASTSTVHGAAIVRDMNIQGEIISVLDDAGAGWKRHTRVYGGGVCLACLESEGKEGGGFYGENVRPEDRRH
ncbi:hypothetical protein Micbo1qcDRAFT_215610 [Microdochium bolleyi]|uniref:Uncharacterized protein n=1 Tax=Microdochium bolleyi TaxID=196109 RepID=A0A136IS14_9PEZI|nr:hypothetical protein Micbo1qcDRAFT_215610 [Microdochium bolleyi]